MALSSPPQALPSTLDLNQILVKLVLSSYSEPIRTLLWLRSQSEDYEQNQNKIRTKHTFRRLQHEVAIANQCQPRGAKRVGASPPAPSKE